MSDELYPKNNLNNIQREDEERVAQQRAEAYRMTYANLSMTPIQEEAMMLFKEEKAREANIAIIYKKGESIKVALQDPKDPKTKEALDELKKTYRNISLVVVSHSSLEEVWEKYPKNTSGKAADITGSVSIDPSTLERFKSKLKEINDINILLSDIEDINASHAFEVLISAALAFDATDIHIEPQRGKTDIRLKIDGMLYEVATINEHLYKLILSRIKLLSSLKLNVHDEPQEGRFSILFEEREIEARISIIPSEYNEDIALRVLDPKFLLSLSELGLRPDLEKELKNQLQQPQGFLLITGATGSGKTTTLYAGLRFLQERELKVITIEDPIEYHLPGITQTQVNPHKEYTFETGLRAILRQDPDIVLLSELRTLESADAAMQAALAGRLVMSTLHTIDAAGTAPRLTDLGGDPSTIASALSASVAQRLVRRLCGECKQGKTITDEEYELFQKILKDLPEKIPHSPLTPDATIHTPSPGGCVECRHTGYKGRIAIVEIVVATKKIKEKIMENPSEEEIRQLAKEEGMTNLKQDAVIRILEGTTSYKEVERVLGTL
ncbi:MAG: GspE/PulE family protein [Candidatus Spechtbacterales bacterium]